MSEQPKSETLKKWEAERGERITPESATTAGEMAVAYRELAEVDAQVAREWDGVRLSDADLVVLRAALPIIERLVGR